MIFTSPIGLLALLAIPAIVAIHLFRRRFPPRTIAGLFLWQMLRQTPEGGGRISKLPITASLILECLAALANRYHALENGESEAVITAWRARAAEHLGRSVEWVAGRGALRGTAHDIDARGALLVRVDDEIIRVISGEVRWLS